MVFVGYLRFQVDLAVIDNLLSAPHDQQLQKAERTVLVQIVGGTRSITNAKYEPT